MKRNLSTMLLVLIDIPGIFLYTVTLLDQMLLFSCQHDLLNFLDQLKYIMSAWQS